MLKQHEENWLALLQGKTLYGIKPVRSDVSPVPKVSLAFTDRSEFLLSVKDDVYFESCLINTLRKAQPVEKVIIDKEATSTTIEVAARGFPLFVITAIDRKDRGFPFELELLP